MRKLFAILTLALGASCGGDSSTNPEVNLNVIGTYNLATVNGAALPFIIQASGPKVEVMGDIIIVNGDGTFHQTTSFRLTEGEISSMEEGSDDGTYTQRGATLAFRYNTDGSTWNGTISGSTLTIGDVGFTTAYVKQ